jgi:N-methylhydantoinase A
VAAGDVELERSIYVMYTGQSWDNRLPVAPGALDDEAVEAIRRATDAHYDAVYGYVAPELGVFVTTLAVTGEGPAPALSLPKIEPGDAAPPAGAEKARHDARFAGELHQGVPFYARAELRAGNRIDGPAVIDDELGTILVSPGCTATVDDHATITIRW